MANFNNEYVGSHRLPEIQKLFPLGESRYTEHGLGNWLELTQYHEWERANKSVLNFHELMPRPAFETWLYRLTLKIAIPFPSRADKYQEITSPFNLTVLFRLCAHLHKRGYPAHWLSDVITSFCSGRITTSARPPRSEPLDLREISRVRPEIEQSVSPFKEEFRIIAAIFQCRLGFGIIVSDLPGLDTIHRYETTFDTVDSNMLEDARAPAYVLVLFDVTKCGEGQYGSLRSYLTDDEMADRSTQAREIRETALHVFSTWHWDEKTRTATVWATQPFMERVKGEQWAITIYRTDNWKIQSRPRRGQSFKYLGPYIPAES